MAARADPSDEAAAAPPPPHASPPARLQRLSTVPHRVESQERVLFRRTSTGLTNTLVVELKRRPTTPPTRLKRRASSKKHAKSFQERPKVIVITWRYRLRQMFKHPHASLLGRIHHYGMLGAIVGNFIPMMLQTLDGPANGGSDPAYPSLPSSDAFYAWEIFFTAIFGLDLGLRCVAAKRQTKFWWQLMTWIDVLGILPVFSTVYMKYQLGWNAIQCATIERYTSLLRLFRIIRVTFMLRNVEGMQVLYYTIVDCVRPLTITFFFLVTIVMVFATVLYYGEPCYNAATCPFTDIVNAGYFVMVTYVATAASPSLRLPESTCRVATVGYGDQVPSLNNPPTILLTVAVMIFGALYLAMPLAIIGIKYELAWQRFVRHSGMSASTHNLRAALHGTPMVTMDPISHRANRRLLHFSDTFSRLHRLVSAFLDVTPTTFSGATTSREQIHGLCIETMDRFHELPRLLRSLEPVSDASSSEHSHRPPMAPRRHSSLATIALNIFSKARQKVAPFKRAETPMTLAETTSGSFRAQLRKALHASGHTTWPNRFYLMCVIVSLVIFYAESMPELHAYGIDTKLCRTSMAVYCAGAVPETDPGCFVWTEKQTPSRTPLDFTCTLDTFPSRCFGRGWNAGTDGFDCTSNFEQVADVCHLRECQPGHRPLIDMTARWLYIELFLAFVFTIEVSLAIFAAKRRRRLFQRTAFWVDVLALVPFYAEIFNLHGPLFAVLPTFPSFESIIPVLKTLRILKLGRYFQASAVLTRTAALTIERLLIPIFFLFMACTTAAAFLYEVERGVSCLAHYPCYSFGFNLMTRDIAAPFPPKKRIQIQMETLAIVKDMWRSSWLATVTLTTVGYGDMKPRTPLGRIFDIVLMIFGSIYTAMPLSLIGGQFYFCYREFVRQEQESLATPVPDAAAPEAETLFATASTQSLPSSSAHPNRFTEHESKLLGATTLIFVPILDDMMATVDNLHEVLKVSAQLTSEASLSHRASLKLRLSARRGSTVAPTQMNNATKLHQLRSSIHTSLAHLMTMALQLNKVMDVVVTKPPTASDAEDMISPTEVDSVNEKST
ncbi:hypothetical protein AeRB84_009957 [Aphanomyces euteiches]|nr:hypothetical protein AeRB84_009957 [Aphanomyces euteiches]